MKKKIAWYYLVITAVVAIDQFTKWLTVTYLKPIGDLPLIKEVLHLTYVENTGAAFGIFKDQRWIFMTISTVTIAAMLVVLTAYKKIPFYPGVLLAMIAGGGIGNMIDRIAYGYVVDFINFELINFAVFNGADSFVCVGGALLLVYILIYDIKESRQKKLEDDEASVLAECSDGDENDKEEI